MTKEKKYTMDQMKEFAKQNMVEKLMENYEQWKKDLMRLDYDFKDISDEFMMIFDKCRYGKEYCRKKSIKLTVLDFMIDFKNEHYLCSETLNKWAINLTHNRVDKISNSMNAYSPLFDTEEIAQACLDQINKDFPEACLLKFI